MDRIQAFAPEAALADDVGRLLLSRNRTGSVSLFAGFTQLQFEASLFQWGDVNGNIGSLAVVSVQFSRFWVLSFPGAVSGL